MTTIESLMKTELVTAQADETVAHAAASLEGNGVGALLVIENGKLAGVLSERDVVSRVVAKGRSPESVRVAEAATAEVVTVDVGVSVRECAELMRKHEIRHLPVTRDGKPVGILSSRDFFAHVVEGLESVIERQRYEQALGEGDDPYDHFGAGYGK